MATQVKRWLFTVDDYARMGEAGILGEDDRVELIAGEIIAMSSIGAPHAGTINRLSNLLPRTLGDTAIIAVQNPIRLSRYSEPQPDLAVLRPRADAYRRVHPIPADVFLLMEVADTSLAYDRSVKLPLYAEASIPEVWIWNVIAEEVERYTEPVEGVYCRMERAGWGQRLASLALPALVLDVEMIFR